jgi:hypothetical protein
MMTAASMPKGKEKNSVESSAASTTTPAGVVQSVMIHFENDRISYGRGSKRRAIDATS